MTSAKSDRRKFAREDDQERRGRRTEPRAYVLLPASAQGHSGRRFVRLVEVSRSGAQLEGSDLPSEGRDIVLRCTGVDTFGKIMWTEDGSCGVQFDEPISVRELMQLRQLSVAIEQSKMTPEEVDAAVAWVSGVVR